MDNKKFTPLELELIQASSSDVPFSVLKITNETDSVFLRQKSLDISPKELGSEVVKTLIERMKVTLIKENGVGLAAPQVGIGRNIFLFMRFDKPDNPVEVAINPQIINHPEDQICFEGDGCLSIPDIGGNTKRYAWIDVEYYNQEGMLVKERLKGGSRDDDFTGIIFQHEFDHLKGILFIDRLIDDSL